MTTDEKGLIEAEKLEHELAECRDVMGAAASGIRRAVAVAKAVGIAKRYVGAVMPSLVELQGSPLGYATDKLYSSAELVNPLTEAAIVGLPFVGNCVNVISGRLYIPLGGWEHRYKTSECVSWPTVRLGEVEVVEEAHYVDLSPEKQYEANGRKVTSRSVPGMARVEAVATCQRDGVEIRVEFRDNRGTGGLDERIAIRVNRGMGEDAVLGKARCKTLKALWREAMGQAAGIVGAEDDDAIEAVPTKTEVKVETQPAATEPSEPPVTLQSFCASLAICRDMAAVARVAKTMGERLPEADKEAGREAVKAKKAELRAADSDGAMGDRQ